MGQRSAEDRKIVREFHHDGAVDFFSVELLNMTSPCVHHLDAKKVKVAGSVATESLRTMSMCSNIAKPIVRL